MKLLENLRFQSIERFLVKSYDKGTERQILSRLYYGFIFCTKGKVVFRKDGNEYLCDSNHVIVSPKYGNYEFTVEEDTVLAMIDFELFAGQYEQIYSIPVAGTETFYQNFLHTKNRYLYRKSSFELMGLSTLYDITARMNGYGTQNQKYKVIESAEKYLQTNICDPFLNIGEVARNSNVSEAYFRRMFKEKHNMSPYQYILEIRINKAKEMLLLDEASISEISEACGFSNLYSFSRTFKESVGVSPMTFKKRHLVSD